MRKTTAVLASLLIAMASSRADAQTSTSSPKPVQAVVTAGVSYLHDDYEDFTKNNGALLVTNDSRFRASGLAGALFRLGDVSMPWGPHQQVGVVTSFQFTQGSAAFLDGFFLGMALELNEQLHLTAGVGLRKGKELSPGFRASAGQVIAERLGANDPAYRRFAGYDGTQKDESILDGLPLTTPGKDTPFFPGDPIVDSYNLSYFVGVSVPVAITKLFSTDDSAKSPQAPPSAARARR